jgi:hypothetical protein
MTAYQLFDRSGAISRPRCDKLAREFWALISERPKSPATAYPTLTIRESGVDWLRRREIAVIGDREAKSGVRAGVWSALFVTIFVPAHTILLQFLTIRYGSRSIYVFMLAEVSLFSLIIAVVLPVLLSRVPQIHKAIPSRWLYRGLLALVACAFIYPALRMLIVAAKFI